MTRGRPRKLNSSIPAHIDQAQLPHGIYWDARGAGHWYVFDTAPGGRRTPRTVAGPRALLSDLYAITEERDGVARGTVAACSKAFLASLDYKRLALTTRKDYAYCARCIHAYKTRTGIRFGDLVVNRLTPPVIRRLIDAIAIATPAKANHWLRYLRRMFAWSIEHGECKTNPAEPVKCVDEVGNNRMPELVVFRAVQAFARARGAMRTRIRGDKGAVAPYLWAVMEIAYSARLRSIEVNTLTDAHDLGALLQTNRRKGSRDNLTRQDAALREAVDALKAHRTTVWAARKTPVPLRPEQRHLVVSEDGSALTQGGLRSAWRRMIAAAIKDGVITPEQRFGLHGLKHRGVTDTQGDKQRASGLTEAMVRHYDHELPEVDPARPAKP